MLQVGAGKTLTVTCEILLQRQGQLGKRNQGGWHAWRHGPVILARNGSDLLETSAEPTRIAERRWQLDGADLVPVSDNWLRPMPDKSKQKNGDPAFIELAQQLLWAD